MFVCMLNALLNPAFVRNFSVTLCSILMRLSRYSARLLMLHKISRPRVTALLFRLEQNKMRTPRKWSVTHNFIFVLQNPLS